MPPPGRAELQPVGVPNGVPALVPQDLQAAEADAAPREIVLELGDAGRHPGALDLQSQVAQLQVEETRLPHRVQAGRAVRD
ncbi:MAG: hypothetical protein AB1635_20290 [Acidobacteriota bacterium]